MIPYDVLMYHTFASFLHIIKCRFSPDQKTHAARPAAGDFFGMDQWTNKKRGDPANSTKDAM